MKKVYIFGAGGFAREVECLIGDINFAQKEYDVVGFAVDEAYYTPHVMIAGYPVFSLQLAMRDADCFAIAVGDSRVRERAVDAIRTLRSDIEFPALVHPSVSVKNRIAISEGAIICSGCIVTCDIEIGRFSILNLNCTVGHDARLDDFCTVNPTCTISGNVYIGKHSFLGTGANILEKVSLGEGSVIGGGALVNKNVSARTIVVGVPAKARG